MECAFRGSEWKEGERKSGSFLVPVSFSCPSPDLLPQETVDPKKNVAESHVSLCSRGGKKGEQMLSINRKSGNECKK